MPDTAQWVAIIIALVGGGFLRDIVFKTGGWLTGRRTAKRSELEKAWDTADREARHRRITEEYASRLTRVLHEAPCVDAADIPARPDYPSRKDTPHD